MNERAEIGHNSGDELPLPTWTPRDHLEAAFEYYEETHRQQVYRTDETMPHRSPQAMVEHGLAAGALLGTAVMAHWAPSKSPLGPLVIRLEHLYGKRAQAWRRNETGFEFEDEIEQIHCDIAELFRKKGIEWALDPSNLATHMED